MKTYDEEVEVEFGHELGYITATASVEAHEVDASFSHEFGTKQEVGIEIDLVECVEVWINGDEATAPHFNMVRKEVEGRAEEAFIQKWKDGDFSYNTGDRRER